MVSSMSSLEKTSLFVWFFPSCCTPRDLRKTSVDLHGFFDVHPWENSVFVWFFPSRCTHRDLRKTSVDLHGFVDVHHWENSVFVRSLCCVVPLTRTCCTFDSQQHKEQTLGWNQAAIKVFSQNITKVIYNSGTRLDFFTFWHISPLSKKSSKQDFFYSFFTEKSNTFLSQSLIFLRIFFPYFSFI